jgi:hypothetical protein
MLSVHYQYVLGVPADTQAVGLCAASPRWRCGLFASIPHAKTIKNLLANFQIVVFLSRKNLLNNMRS